jgi:hypothetical protein
MRNARNNTVWLRAAIYSLALLSAASVGYGADTAKLKAEEDIQEATFRYQFLHNASGLKQNAQFYFLSLGEKNADPSDEFMKRFAGHKPVAKKRSQSTGGAGGIKDKETGGSGLIFTVSKIKWVSETEVEVEGGYYEAGLSASGNTYYLKKEKEKWAVTKDVMHWIS